MRDYTKYEVWKEGIENSLEVYELTSTFPEDEKFGLVSQLRRAAVSIPSNFAEGCSRSSEKEFNRFIEISLGSSFELKTQLLIANKLGYVPEIIFLEVISRIEITSKKLNTLRNKINEDAK